MSGWNSLGKACANGKQLHFGYNPALSNYRLEAGQVLRERSKGRVR
jgi:hypothetical protein